MSDFDIEVKQINIIHRSANRPPYADYDVRGMRLLSSYLSLAM